MQHAKSLNPNTEKIQTTKISVITATLNSEKTLQRCIDSVTASTYPNIEHIVIDGGSTDTTISILKKNGTKIKWISEKDNGISDALNKGVKLASGKYYITLSSDDWLNPDGIDILIKNSKSKLVICGSVKIITSDGLPFKTSSSNPNFLTKKSSIHHGASLIDRSVHNTIGPYRLDKRICMDHALFFAILNYYGPTAFISTTEIISNYSLGGLSDQHAIDGFIEVRDTLRESGLPSCILTFNLTLLIIKHLATRILLFFSKKLHKLQKLILNMHHD